MNLYQLAESVITAVSAFTFARMIGISSAIDVLSTLQPHPENDMMNLRLQLKKLNKIGLFWG